MLSGNNGDIFNLFLGPRSSLSGSLFNEELNQYSLSVDFHHAIAKPYEQSKVDKEDILWDEQITKIDGSIEHVREVDPYSPNTDLHWSQISAGNDRRIVELPYCNKFESFHTGVSFFNENNLGEVFEDKVRYQLEKSDVFSGFVAVHDVNSGYSGILACLFPLLDDAFGRKPRITFGLSSENPALFELDSMSDGSICSFVNFKSFKGSYRGLLCQESDYHTCAVLSVFLQQVLQIHHRGSDFKDLTNFLSPLSRNIFMSYSGVPFDDPDDRSISKLFSPKFLASRVKPLSILSNQMLMPLHHSYLSVCGLTGISNNHQFFSSLSQLKSTEQVFGATTKYCYTPQSLNIPPSYPQFFSDQILSDGHLRSPHQKVRCIPVRETPSLSVLQNNQQPMELIEKVLSKKMKVSENTELLTAGVLDEDISDIRQRLSQLSDNYTLC